MHQTDDLHVVGTCPLTAPQELKRSIPLTSDASDTVYASREAIKAILSGQDERFLVIVGPCSIHDYDAAIEYARRLKELQPEVADRIFLVMRTYFEKPRTTLGWKGFINDPTLDGACDLNQGLARSRALLVAITELGVPAGAEMLEPIVPQFIADTVSWASIGARTIESQTHREMASGFSMPVGFKNSTDGNLQIAINAIVSARRPHHFLGIDQDGRACSVETRGNPWGHLILRGGGGRPNYDPVSVAEARERLEKAGLPPRIMVDCSHANCGKRYELQAHVLRDVVQQRIENERALIGVMIESNLKEGAQKLANPPDALTYGVSITDPCLGWEDTQTWIRYAYKRLGMTGQL